MDGKLKLEMKMQEEKINRLQKKYGIEDYSSNKSTSLPPITHQPTAGHMHQGPKQKFIFMNQNKGNMSFDQQEHLRIQHKI